MKGILRKFIQFILIFLIVLLLGCTSSIYIPENLNNNKILNSLNNDDDDNNNPTIVETIVNSIDLDTGNSFELRSKNDKFINYIINKNSSSSESTATSIVNNSSDVNSNFDNQSSTNSKGDLSSKSNDKSNSRSSSSSNPNSKDNSTTTNIDSDKNIIPKGWVKWTVMLDDYKNEIPYSKVYYYPNGDIILENKKGESLYYDLYYQIWNNPLVPKDWTSLFIGHDENGNLNPNDVSYYYEDGRIIDSKGNVEYRILQ